MDNLKFHNFSIHKALAVEELEVVDTIMAKTAETMEETIMVMDKTWEAITIHTLSITQTKVVGLIMYRRNSSTDLPASIRKSERPSLI